jgi:hypothetical protein
MALTYVAIATVTVGSGGAANIEFTSIPATYTDLVLFTSLRVDRASNVSTIKVEFNGNTTDANYPYRRVQGENLVAQSDGASATDILTTNAGNSTASTFSNGFTYIPNYTSSNQKSISTDVCVLQNSGTSGLNATLYAARWTQTSAITSIKLSDEVDSTILQYSTATLYGIKNTV